MSENTVITEFMYTPQEESAPQGNPYDGTEEAYAEHDKQQALETALTEKKETDLLRSKLEESEDLDSEELEDSDSEDLEVESSKTDEFSSKFAALSRREKQLREREAQMQSQYEAKLAQLEEKLMSLQSKSEESQVESEPELPLEYRLKRDPLGTLKELGLSYDQLTNLALNDGKLTIDMQMDLMRQDIESKHSKELESIRKELQERDRRSEEEKYNETVQNFQNELADFVNDNDKYELIRANDAVDVVYQVIEEHYNNTGRIISKEEASDQVETYLEAELEKMLNLNKIKSKFSTQAESQQAQVQSTEPKQTFQTQKAPTLSNTHSTTVSNTRRPATRDDSVSLAASLLKWNE
jgi:hypothetical protein